MSASWIPDPEREAPRDAREARRLSRMEETWKVLAASDLEVAAKRRQALPRALGRKARRPRPVLWGLAAALAVGAVFAAGGVLVWSPASSEQTSSNVALVPSSAPVAQQSSGKTTHTEVEPTKGESEVAVPPVPSDPGASHRAPEQVLRAAPRPSDGSQAGASRGASSATASPTSEGWDAVAAALREDDPERARAVLDELTKRQDPATQDAAALARAQLDWSQGERERARRELERLAARGATKEIRAQAARSIERFEER